MDVDLDPVATLEEDATSTSTSTSNESEQASRGLSAEQRTTMLDKFTLSRSSSSSSSASSSTSSFESPALYLATVRDPDSKLWTRQGPSAGLLAKTQQFAALCLDVLSSMVTAALARPVAAPATITASASASASASVSLAQFVPLFKTPLEAVDVFIVLKHSALPAHYTARSLNRLVTRDGAGGGARSGACINAIDDVDDDGSNMSGGKVKHIDKDKKKSAYKLPPDVARRMAALEKEQEDADASTNPRTIPALVGWEPAEFLAAEVKREYGTLVEVAYDSLGGRLLLLKWRAGWDAPRPFSVTAASFTKPVVVGASGGPNAAVAAAPAVGGEDDDMKSINKKKNKKSIASSSVPYAPYTHVSVNVDDVLAGITALGDGVIEGVFTSYHDFIQTFKY